MTIYELIQELSKFDADEDVYIGDDDGEFEFSEIKVRQNGKYFVLIYTDMDTMKDFYRELPRRDI